MVYRYRKLVQLGLLGVGGLSVTYNIDELETATVGAVRFGRAAVTVSNFITAFYNAFTTLKNLLKKIEMMYGIKQCCMELSVWL